MRSFIGARGQPSVDVYTCTGTHLEQHARRTDVCWYHVPVLLLLMRTYVGHTKVRVSPRFFPFLPFPNLSLLSTGALSKPAKVRHFVFRKPDGVSEIQPR